MWRLFRILLGKDLTGPEGWDTQFFTGATQQSRHRASFALRCRMSLALNVVVLTNSMRSSVRYVYVCKQVFQYAFLCRENGGWSLAFSTALF